MRKKTKPTGSHRAKPSPLPSEADFTEDTGCLDAEGAWRNFGGLTLDEAYERFITNPENYQEDFMFMRHRAFEYYFPVIDRYLREVKPVDKNDDCEAGILGCVIELQLQNENPHLMPQCIAEIVALTEFVLQNVDRCLVGKNERHKVRIKWERVAAKATEYRKKYGCDERKRN